MDTRNSDIKISMPNTPVGLSEWTNEAVNQVILESNVIQTMINNLNNNDIPVLKVEKNKYRTLGRFLNVYIDGFVLYFSHQTVPKENIIQVTFVTLDELEHPQQSIFEMEFFCTFNKPIIMFRTKKPGFSRDHDYPTHLEMLPDQSKDIAEKAIRILKEAVEFSEYNITEINM